MLEEIESEIKAKNGITKMFLDYDGTLVDLTTQPELAVPGQQLLDLLAKLKIEIPLYLVTGRDLEGIIALVGHGFNIIAMHGSEFVNENGQKWFIDHFDDYQRKTKELYEKYSHLEREYPGLRIIDKKGGLQFHYYNVDERYVDDLEKTVSGIHEDGFELYSGKYVYELRVKGVDKGKAIMKLLESDDFILFAGDDRTDEEAFKMLKSHVTIKVGDGVSAARFRVDSPTGFKKFLSDLLDNKKEMVRNNR
ncbi:MAG: trehalose-phosphatase [Thermoplasmatales archaeon]